MATNNTNGAAYLYLGMFIVAAFAFFYSLIDARLEKTFLSGPVIFLAFGFAIGPFGFGLIET